MVELMGVSAAHTEEVVRICGAGLVTCMFSLFTVSLAPTGNESGQLRSTPRVPPGACTGGLRELEALSGVPILKCAALSFRTQY